MKWWSFKALLWIALCLPLTLSAQESMGGRIGGGHTPATPALSAYERGVNQYTSFWNSLIPKYTKMQFAGSIGLISAGVGWNYGKDRWETDFLFGIVPRYTDHHAMATFTVKQNYMPWKVRLNDSFMFEPLTCGLYLNTLLDEDFWVLNPDRYPSGYYTFSTRIRTHIFVGERLTFYPDKRRYPKRHLTFFYELSTCDLYLISAVGNRYLKPSDYLSLSFGIKFQIL
ncbi:hypothetical protein [Parabacteroides sp. PF5-6]|uniref:hypothetical protein n=1 Tax=Parabacteroides sp. PF5-6 TaxID=1742403 RepID=UPI00240729C9|nr:hypothetical protein [Parabacteroides sp. PF5-6]MDF9830441.1 hypothetical protein [Parabacteroides sp. PF5-6]